jgi:hypothetical protein
MTATIEDQLSSVTSDAELRYREAIILCTHGNGEMIDIRELHDVCAAAGRTPVQALADVRCLKERIFCGDAIKRVNVSHTQGELLAQRDAARVAVDAATRKCDEAEVELRKASIAYQNAATNYQIAHSADEREVSHCVQRLQRTARPGADPMKIADFILAD